MKILHTSDWHLGRSLYGKKRYEEFDAFLGWMLQTINEQQIDVLLIAGDIFDTTTPSNRAQQQYYQFLWQVSQTACEHVVIIGGNHDSPSFLNAPKALLAALDVHVVGAKLPNPADEVIVLKNAQTQCPQAIICAVPYLRDKDLRTVEAGEGIDDKNQKLIAAIKGHYAEVAAIAVAQQQALIDQGHPAVPIIGMGHLFTAGGKQLADDGVRDLYVGSLAYVGADAFPEALNYVALGHLHVPQTVAGTERIRYCGSPIPMGFGEAKQTKQVNLVQFDAANTPQIEAFPIPCFQPLVRIAGDVAHIQQQIQQLKAENSTAWLEIEYTGEAIVNHLNALALEQIEGSQLEIRRIRNARMDTHSGHGQQSSETLADLTEHEVFERCLEAYEVPEAQRAELRAAYQEIINELHEADVRSE